MAIPLRLADMDYYYQQAIRKRQRTPPSVRALPSTSDIDLAHITAKTDKEEAARHFAEQLKLKRERLAEAAREHNREFAFKNRLLDEAKTADRLATGISAANLGVAGMGAKLSLKNLKERKIMDQDLLLAKKELIDIQKQNLELLKPFYEKAFLNLSENTYAYEPGPY